MQGVAAAMYSVVTTAYIIDTGTTIAVPTSFLLYTTSKPYVALKNC